jgi:hypothetical protein
MTNNVTVSVASGADFVRCDTATDLRVLNYCKNNVASWYEGYELHYKLATPEVITDGNCNIQGDIPVIDSGDNYLYLDSGIVLGEAVKPIYYSGNNTYWINATDVNAKVVNPMEYKTETIRCIFKNQNYDVTNWVIQSGSSALIYGMQRAYINPVNFDASATYTVDYKILATQAPQIGSIACSYAYDIVDVLNKALDSLNSKQVKDSALDDIVDMSMCEKVIFNNDYLSWIYGSNLVYLNIPIKFSVLKKTLPAITVKGLVVKTLANGDITNKVRFIAPIVQKDSVIINLSVSDSTLITDIKNNGVFAYAEITADCRGRI